MTQLPPGIREHHGSYQVHFYGPNGERRARSFDRLSDARRFKRGVDADRDRGELIDPRLGRTPFAGWAWEHLNSKHDLRASTRATDESYMRNHVAPAFGPAPLDSIKPLAVQAWVNALSRELAPKTVRECYRLMGAVMRAAVDARLIAESPCRGIKLPRRPHQEQRFLTVEQVDTLADAIDPHFRALVYSAAYLGARWGELAGLKRENLDLLRRRVHIVGTLEEIGGHVRYVPETKSGASRRTIGLPNFLVDLLASHLAEAPVGEHVFTTKRGAPLRRSAFRASYWLPAVERADLGPLRVHDLRHTCAGLLIEAGAHPKAIQARLGHSSISTTLNTYGHLMPSLDERLADALDDAKAKREGDQMGTKGPATVVELPARDGAHAP